MFCRGQTLLAYYYYSGDKEKENFITLTAAIAEVSSSQSEFSHFFECKACDKKFRKRQALKMHQFVVHEKPKGFDCVICKEAFAESFHLIMHLDKCHRHEMKCQLCLRTFSEAFRFLRHCKNTHKRARLSENQCHVCQAQCKSEEGLKKHFRENHDELVCKICNKHYNCRSNLKQHQRIHNKPSTVLKSSPTTKVKVERNKK
jgi:Zinc-finger of C2H2 type